MQLPIAKNHLKWALLVSGILAIGTAVLLMLLPPGGPSQEALEYTRIESDPAPFLGGLRSYDRVDTATNRLQAIGYSASRTSSHKPVHDDYPPRDLDTLEVYGFEHLNSRGRLLLEFFNDRLYQAEFEPEKPRPYLARLHAAEPALRRDRNGRSELTRGSLRVATNLDFAVSKVGRQLNTRPYVLWQDLRLKQQLAEWESRYGSIAANPD